MCDAESVIIAIRSVVPLKILCAEDKLRNELKRLCLINDYHFMLFNYCSFTTHWSNA